MGFKENSKTFQFEKTIYDLVREGKDGFYYHVSKDLNISSSANVSALVTLQNDLLPHKENEMVVGLQFLVLKKMRRYILFN